MEIYTEQILGPFSFIKKESNKDKWVYKRSKTITLAKEYAQVRLNPETMKKEKVHGSVNLSETRVIDRETGRDDYFRSLELTDGSVSEPMV